MSKPKEFWILDHPENPYPTCYRGEPTWGCEPDNTGAVVHVREVTALIEAASELLDFVKRFDADRYCDADQINGTHSDDCEACAARALIAKVGARES